MSLLHETIDQWEQSLAVSDAESTWCYVRVVLHEWVANLVQHADFFERMPSMVVAVWRCDQGLCGFVRDNSSGFDLDDHLQGSLEDIPLRMPERGMGLLMLHDTAHLVTYTRNAPRRNTLYFCVQTRPSLDVSSA